MAADDAQDPSRLTTEQLREAIRGLEAKIAARLDSMDRAAILLHEDYVRVPTLLDRAIIQVRELLEEKIHKLDEVSAERFGRIEIQFVERDKRTEQLALANATAIAAALQAAKEAVGEQNRSAAVAIAKSENSTAESIKQLQVLFSSDRSATNDKINDVKSRLDKGEGISSGFSKGGGVIVQVITSVLSATAIIVTVLLHH